MFIKYIMNNIDATKLCQVSHILYNKTILELSKQINKLKKENNKLKKINKDFKNKYEPELDATHIFNDISGHLVPHRGCDSDVSHMDAADLREELYTLGRIVSKSNKI
jgi:hypothetical protein